MYAVVRSYERAPRDRLGCDDVFLFFLIESCNAFETHVVALGGAGGEHNLTRRSTDQVCHMLTRFFHSRLGLPPVFVCAGMGVAIPAWQQSSLCVRTRTGMPIIYPSFKKGIIASRTRGSIGVVDCTHPHTIRETHVELSNTQSWKDIFVDGTCMSK